MLGAGSQINHDNLPTLRKEYQRGEWGRGASPKVAFLTFTFEL